MSDDTKDNTIKALSIFYKPGDVVELRIPKDSAPNKKTISGYFSDFEKLADTVVKYNGLAKTIYITLNPVIPDLLSRYYNRVEVGAEDTTNDTQIVKRCCFLIDVDAQRPKNISSTDEEHRLAHERAIKIRQWLSSIGWALPVYADSGNGAHLVYVIDLPNTEKSEALLKRCLEALASFFDDVKIKIDRTVFNASRIFKLYGTKVCKGDNTPERPHRVSKLLEVPDKLELITVEQLKELAKLAPEAKQGQEQLYHEQKTDFDIEAWLKKHGIAVKNVIRETSRTIYVFTECPFNPEHKDASVTQLSNGALAFNCFHNSCSDKKWQDFRLRFEPDAYKKKTKSEAKESESQATVLIKYAESNDIELFHDEYHDPYARVKIDEKLINLSIKERGFKRWITQQYYNKTGKAVGNDAYQSAINVIEAKACFDGKEKTLHNRVCWNDGAIWYDIGDWTAVKITPQDWVFVNDLPILFKRYKHQKSHVQSQNLHNGDVKKVLDFVNIKDDQNKLLCLVYLVHCFIPDIPHIILVIYGDKGGAKTTLFKVCKELIDPSTLKILTFPKDNTELVQKLSHHYYAPFDNVTSLSDWQSDALCRASTGEGFSKRELYTDDEDVIYSFKRCIGLNGINVVATKPDILDRSILLRLDRIPKKNCKTETEFWQAFDKVKGEILGGIFTAISKAMAIYPAIKLDEIPRMADFTVWGCAIAEALGYGKDAFLDAYYTNLQAQNREAIEGIPVGELILRFMDDKTEWEGRPSELLTELEKLAGVIKINIKAKSFPKAANVMVRRLNEIKTNLLDEGIIFEISHSTIRTIKIRKKPSESSYRPNQEQEQAKTKDDTKDDTKSGYRPKPDESEKDDTKKNQNSELSYESSYKNQDAEPKQDDKDDKDDISRTFRGEIEKSCHEWKQAHQQAINSSNVVKAVFDLKSAYPYLTADELAQHIKRYAKLTPEPQEQAGSTAGTRQELQLQPDLTLLHELKTAWQPFKEAGKAGRLFSEAQALFNAGKRKQAFLLDFVHQAHPKHQNRILEVEKAIEYLQKKGELI